jgi:hypothetical protein
LEASGEVFGIYKRRSSGFERFKEYFYMLGLG